MDFKDIKKQLKKELDKERYHHTKGVMYTAGCLAMAHGYDIQEAMLAGLLHDCAKCISTEEKINICKKANLEITETEYANPGLLHAKAGAVLANTKYDVNNNDIVHAILVHTTGAPNMNTLDKIIYIADYIEPSRTEAPRLDYIRMIAYKDLDLCMAEILYDSLKYLETKKIPIDKTTKQTYKYYKKYRKE